VITRLGEGWRRYNVAEHDRGDDDDDYYSVGSIHIPLLASNVIRSHTTNIRTSSYYVRIIWQCGV
jgi:hypothetical protein